MGTLPFQTAGTDVKDLPFGRSIELSMNFLVEPDGTFDWNTTSYGPCPLGSIPPFQDTRLPSSSFPPKSIPWYFAEVLDPSGLPGFSPALRMYPPDGVTGGPEGQAWNRSRRIQCWNNVLYDYTTTNSMTGQSGTGPRLYKDISDGQFVITASENRPVPYVTWLNLSVGLEAYGYWKTPVENSLIPSGALFPIGRWSFIDNFYINKYGFTAGIIRHSPTSEDLNYSLLATLSVNQEMLNWRNWTKDFGWSVLSNGPVDPQKGWQDYAFPSQVVAALTQLPISMFAFDVVPPGETYVVQAGWQARTRNDWSITAMPEDVAVAFIHYPPTGGDDPSGNPLFVYPHLPESESIPPFQKLAGSTPNNRFGVMTF